MVENCAQIAVTFGAAYEAFMLARLERRAGRRGKVHARAARSFVEMMGEMIADAAGGHDPETLWHMALAELDRDRGEVEADVLTDGALVEVEHEWAALLSWMEGKLSTSLAAPST